MSKKENQRQAKIASDANCELHAFGTVIRVLEGGVSGQSQKAAEKIILLCNREMQKLLEIYDQAMDDIR